MKMIKMMIIVMMGTAMGNIVDKTCREIPDSDPRSSSGDIVGLGLILLHNLFFDQKVFYGFDFVTI